MTRFRTARVFAAILVVLTVGAAPSFAANIIPNGSFESTFHDFYSAYTEVTTPGPEAMWAEGTYALGVNPFSYHKYWASYSPYDGDAMMIVNGATGTGIKVWSSSDLAVADNTTYYFSAWVASSYYESPAVLQFSINGAPLGTAFTASTTTGNWQRFYATWNSGTSGVARLSLLNMNTTASGNDFTLDDMSLDTERPTGIETTVPEPASLVLLGMGLLGAGRAWRKRRP